VLWRHGEELSRLRAERTSLLQLVAVKDQLLASKDAQLSTVVACKDEVIASKDELLACRAAELQHCKAELLQSRPAISEPLAAAADSSKLQCLRSSSKAAAPLERDDLLDCVFSYVGGGDHLYTGGVCRRWRGRYIQYCVQEDSAGINGKLLTRRSFVLVTESRLRLALSSGLAVTGWSLDTLQKSKMICKLSLEPEKVMALLRVHGVPWSADLCTGAAYFNKLVLLQWLHSHSCPWDVRFVLHYASTSGGVAMLDWLLTVTDPWSYDTKRGMLHAAGCYSNMPTAQWVRAHGAVWPKSFWTTVLRGNKTFRASWSVSVVKWAQASGSGWRNWKCADYTAEQCEDVHFRQQATELLEWAHANGCPCTCEHAEQQQQQ
jgi:hypothetical protein